MITSRPKCSHHPAESLGPIARSKWLAGRCNALDKQFFVFQMDGYFSWSIFTTLPYSLTVQLAFNRTMNEGAVF